MSIEKKGWINHDYKNQIQLTYCTLIIYSYHIIVDQSASQIESMIIFSSNVNLRNVHIQFKYLRLRMKI